MRLLRMARHIFFGTYARGFIFSYLFVMVLGASLLKLPISIQEGVTLSWFDAFFTASSALSVTGLTTIVVNDVFTVFGQTVLLLIIQFGGIGLIMMLAIFWLAVRKRIGFKERNMIMTDQNQLSRQGIVRFIRNVIIVIFTIEGLAFLFIGFYLYFSGHFPVINEAFFQSFFLTISLFTNAGFDIAPNNDSYQMFHQDYVMQSIGMFLIFMGAVGFWALAEFKEKIIGKIKRQPMSFSPFVKILLMMYIALWVLGALVIFILEQQHFLADKGFIESVYYAFFMSITTRNAGFSTMDVNDFTSSTQTFLMVLMFIGASPNSVGGGIRTTTFLVIILAVRSFATGREEVIFLNRRIKQETIIKSFVALTVALSLVVGYIFVLSIIEPFPTSHIAFEVTSAFGTTGLSLGITSELHPISKILLSVLMFIGRMGVIALLLMFKPNQKVKGRVQYPDMNLIVG